MRCITVHGYWSEKIEIDIFKNFHLQYNNTINNGIQFNFYELLSNNRPNLLQQQLQNIIAKYICKYVCHSVKF